MADNVVGSAWVAIKPDLTGFTSELMAGVTSSIAQVQATVKPISIPVTLDTGPLLAEIAGLKAATAAAGGTGGGQGGAGLLGGLLWGAGGLAGFAAFGSIASLAGLGFEHVLTTGIGLAGSFAGALAGLGVIATGVFGKMAAGMASDMLVMSSTIADSKAMVQGYDALAKAVTVYGQQSAAAKAAQGDLNFLLQSLGATPGQGATLAQAYSNVANAVALYGDNSKQASKAQAQLTKDINAFGLQGVQAELKLQQAAATLNTFWDLQTQKARVAAVGFLMPFQSIAYTYIPLIGAAATKNFGSMTAAFKPLITWIDTTGTGFFKNLENLFAQSIPVGVNILTQFVELLAKIANWAAPQTGSFLNSISTFLDNLNTPSGFVKLEGVMTTLIGMFKDWWGLAKQLGITLYDLFSQSVGLGTSIVTTITGMLKSLDKWLTSTSGRASIHNLFAVHLQEIQAILGVLPTLLGAFAQVYLAIAPPLVVMVTGMADFVGWVLKIPLAGPLLALAAAVGIFASKMKLWTVASWIGDLYKLTAAFVALAGSEGIVAAFKGIPGLASTAFNTGSGAIGARVFVTNWAMFGGEGSGPGGIVSKGGILGTIIGAMGGAAAALTALGVAAGFALPVIAAFAFWKPPGTSGAQQGLTGIAGLFADLQNAQNSPPGSGGGHGGAGLQPQVQANLAAITAYLQGIGLPLGKAQTDAGLIRAAFVQGSIKTPAQLDALILKLTGINTAMATVSTAVGLYKGIVGKSVPQIDFGFVTLQNELVSLGWSFGKSVAYVDLLQATIAKYGPLTQVQINTIYNDFVHGATSAFDIALSLKTAASNISGIPASASGIAAALAALHKSIPGSGNLPGGGLGFFTGPHAAGGFIPPGMWGTASENEIVLGGRSGATVLSASQSRRAGVTVNNYNAFYGVGKETIDVMDKRIQRNNRQLVTALRSL